MYFVLRLHPEVWIELSRLEQSQVPPRVTEARAVLKEGIDLIPDIALLRIGLAEFEESQSNFEAAREAYRGAFEAVPCALTFSSFQKFVRRREGQCCMLAGWLCCNVGAAYTICRHSSGQAVVQ